jgi:hypothetical protein
MQKPRNFIEWTDSTLFQYGVLIVVRRGATAEEFQNVRVGVANLMPGTGRNRNRVPRADRADLAADQHQAATFQDAVNLFVEK